MLELFQIKDLHEDPAPSASTGPGFARGRRGIIQLSASDYDQIATDHPRSRLMYMDDDDGEVITVGSSLELSQRLEDPISLEDFPINSISEDIPTTYPMHIFDIRRSNSVTDLWKKYEYQPPTSVDRTENATNPAPEPQSPSHANVEQNGHAEQEIQDPPTPVAAPAPAPEDREMEPLMAAFEAQLASILRASEDLSRVNEQPDNSRAPPTQPTPQPDTQPNSAQGQNDPFTMAVHNLIEGAEKIRSGVMSRLPEFERQLQNAQRALPEPVGSSVQATLIALEDQARNLASALNNAANTRGPRGGNIFQGDLPTATETVSGLRNLAFDIGSMGQTLFQAFESEFRCNRAQGPQTTGESSAPPAAQDAESAPTSGPEVSPLHTASMGIPPAQNANGEPRSQPIPFFQPPPLAPEEMVQPTGLGNEYPPPMPSEPYLAICPPAPSPGPGATLFIGNVGFGAHDRMIRDVFFSKGFNPRVSLLRYPGAQQHAGFGYAYFDSTHEAKAALEAVQGTHIDGHSINLEFSDLPPPQSSDPALQNTYQPASTEEGADHTNGRRSALSVADLCSNDTQRSANLTSSHASLGAHSQMDSQRFNTLYPSLMPESTLQRPTTSSSHEILPDQESRFPPVSQLDAHFSSERARGFLNNPPAAQQDTPTNRNFDSGELHGLPGSYPSAPEVDHGAQQELPAGPRPWDLGNVGYSRHGAPWRRQSMHHTWRGNGHFYPTRPLRRQHTERHHGRGRWPTYELPTYSPSAPQPTPSSQENIDQCVATLANLGYGSEEEGGLSRIAVYAAAVNGKVLDAIEMIEEDRKAYEQRSDNRAMQ